MTVEATRETARKRGKALREKVPRTSHGDWRPAPDRPDPVELITDQDADRLQWLVPIRHWRMSQSAFSFYRGGAAIMAADLAETPVSGLSAQICGDAHLSNFGTYGSPERDLVFDVNDFDETLPGPWEWDLKRLGASFAIAARHNEYDTQDEFGLPTIAAATYRQAMARFAEMRYLDVWYAHLTSDDIYAAFKDQLTKKEKKAGQKFSRKARSKNSLHAFKKLAEETPDGYRIMSQPPLIIPLRDWPRQRKPAETRNILTRLFKDYLSTLPDHMSVLLERFAYRDMAVKVVGVGSVGTRCFIVLLKGRDAQDPFFLQIKEAVGSVLEAHLPKSRYAHHGQRVVAGQHLMQAASDSFLGWTSGAKDGKDYYCRQFKDMKGSMDVDEASRRAMRRYAGLCGWTLARAHARSGDAAAIAGYLGSGETFDRALAEFSVAYADQNEKDYAAFIDAIDTGSIEAHE
jgi:uncharacterized protein (DUF2252 family)